MWMLILNVVYVLVAIAIPVTLALTNVVGGSAATTATFNAAGEILTLVSAGAKWIVLDELGVTLA